MTTPNHNVRTKARLRCGEKPTEPKSPFFVTVLGIAQFALFVGLLGPVMVSMALKVNSLIADPGERVGAIGLVLGTGAIAALVGNVVFGRLSDRTTSRFGRRRPWIVGGVVVMAVALASIALAQSVPMLVIGWLVAQLGANACFSPFIATLADQLPDHQHAKVSAMVGIMQNVGILGATYIVSLLNANMLLVFVVPALIAVVGMVVYALVLPDPVLEEKPGEFDLVTLLKTFWVSPRQHPDFAWAWLSRFCIVIAMFLFITFRLNYLVDRIGLDGAGAVKAIAIGVLVYTIALVATGWVAGVVSDRTGKRKMMVAASCLCFGIGTVLLIQADTVMAFYVVEAVMGLAFGIYMSVDMALVLEVLPNPKESGKDLGVFNIANALPQSLAPYLGSLLLGLGATTIPNYPLLLWVAGLVCAVGAAAVLPIKKVN